MLTNTQRITITTVAAHAIGRHGWAVTAWFEPGTKPARPGVYERQVHLAPYSYWNGLVWGMSSQTPARALFNRHVESLHQDARWRGLAQEVRS
ncbi:MAG: hypothetical protein RJA36_3529 [Pseudomonadota bacterium]|jgi:hypothetical protein